jgi:hypothetical protein
MDKESPMQSEGLSLLGKIGAIPVANRIVMSPLTRARADKEGKQTALAVDYYRQRASAGLLITEATNISRQGRGYAFTPGIYTDEHVAAWRPVTDAVHEAGTATLPFSSPAIFLSSRCAVFANYLPGQLVARLARSAGDLDFWFHR